MPAFRPSLGVALVVVLVAGFTPLPVGADVTGSFALNVTLIPTDRKVETTAFFVELQSTLQLNVTLSGLTLGLDAGLGTTGAELAILRLSTTLGALTAFDEFVFATPFYNSSTADPITADELHPTSAPGSVSSNGPAFVKKRVTLTLNVAGITLSNLVIFEDVDFPNPLQYVNPSYNPQGVDAIVDSGGRGLSNQTPSFGLGDVITVEGQTLGGVKISSNTGLCVRLEHNVIKKRTWPESVDPTCGTKSALLFDFERVRVGNVVLGGITLNGDVFWSPPVSSAQSVLSFKVLNKADAVLTLSSHVITHLKLDVVRLDVTAGGLSFSASDFNGDLNIDLVEVALDLTLNPNQSPASLRLAGSAVTGVGLVFGQVALSVKKNPLTFTLNAVFDTAVGGAGISWAYTRFDLSVKTGLFDFTAHTTLSVSGLRQAVFKLNFAF